MIKKKIFIGQLNEVKNKKKQTLLTLFLLISIGLSQEYNIDDLVERDGIYFEKFSDTPIKGKVYKIIACR